MYSMKIVAYQRVSTSKQGQSGLDLDAQWAAIQTYAAQAQGAVIERFTEVESGKSNSRPELAKALQLAKLTGAVLVIAKLDRLSRNAAFLLTLRDSGVHFVAADMPDANDLTVGIMALVAEQERQAISKRTKEALKAAKTRGTRLGKPWLWQPGHQCWKQKITLNPSPRSASFSGAMLRPSPSIHHGTRSSGAR